MATDFAYPGCSCCGAGGGVPTSCCPADPVPGTLYATVTGSACDGVYPMIYDGSAWFGLADFYNGSYLRCEGVWEFTFNGFPLSPDPGGTCGPFALTFSNIHLGLGHPCAIGLSPVTITFTE